MDYCVAFRETDSAKVACDGCRDNVNKIRSVNGFPPTSQKLFHDVFKVYVSPEEMKLLLEQLSEIIRKDLKDMAKQGAFNEMIQAELIQLMKQGKIKLRRKKP